MYGNIDRKNDMAKEYAREKTAKTREKQRLYGDKLKKSKKVSKRG